jgi:glycine cleavage system H protein
MSELPDDLKYTKTHEWVRVEDNGTVTIGITDHAQETLGDLVFVELPTLGQLVSVEEPCGLVESVKAAADIFSPISGEIIACNEKLVNEPELINTSPYEDGWLFKLKPDGDSQLTDLLTVEEYTEVIETED